MVGTLQAPTNVPKSKAGGIPLKLALDMFLVIWLSRALPRKCYTLVYALESDLGIVLNIDPIHGLNTSLLW